MRFAAFYIINKELAHAEVAIGRLQLTARQLPRRSAPGCQHPSWDSSFPSEQMTPFSTSGWIQVSGVIVKGCRLLKEKYAAASPTTFNFQGPSQITGGGGRQGGGTVAETFVTTPNSQLPALCLHLTPDFLSIKVIPCSGQRGLQPFE